MLIAHLAAPEVEFCERQIACFAMRRNQGLGVAKVKLIATFYTVLVFKNLRFFLVPNVVKHLNVRDSWIH